jgi:hypothetical protein
MFSPMATPRPQGSDDGSHEGRDEAWAAPPERLCTFSGKALSDTVLLNALP